MLNGLVPQPLVQINVVNVVSAHLLPAEVPVRLKVSNHLAHRPLRDTYGKSYLPSSALRVMVNVSEHQPMLGYDSPASHPANHKGTLY